MAGKPDVKEMVFEVVTSGSGLLWAAYAGFNFDPVAALGNEPGIMAMTALAVVSLYSIADRFGVVD